MAAAPAMTKGQFLLYVWHDILLCSVSMTFCKFKFNKLDFMLHGGGN